MKALTLSIVIPVYNEENYIARCLDAVASQTEAPDEVIVVDNNSTDGTLEIVKGYRSVRLVHEPRQGLFFARQTGMNAAKGDIIGRIDADTILDDHWVRAVKRAFVNQSVHAVSGPVGYHDMPFPDFTKRTEDRFLRLAHIGNYAFLMGANMALRRSAWQLIRDELCNEPFLLEDIDMAIHLQEAGLRPAYRSRMSATVSSRRIEDKPLDFMRYIRGHTRTHKHHDRIKPVGAHMAESIFALTYLSLKPFHMAYDPSRRRPSLSRLLRRRVARPDPMATGQLQD